MYVEQIYDQNFPSVLCPKHQHIHKVESFLQENFRPIDLAIIFLSLSLYQEEF